MMKKITLIAALLFTNVSCFSAENDFDKVCNYFVELQAVVKSKALTKTDRKQFISNLVSKDLQPQSAARQAWEVVIYAVPEVRYELYKTSAEESLNRKWECGAMQTLISSAGE